MAVSGTARRTPDRSASMRPPPPDPGAVVHQQLLAHSVDILIGIDDSGTCLAVNDTAARLLGYRPDDVIGRNVLELVHPSDQDTIVRELAELDTSGVSNGRPSYLRVLHADGSWRWMEALAHVPPPGTFPPIVVAVRDAEAIHKGHELTNLVAELATRLIGPVATVAGTIEMSLARIATEIGADRAYVFELDLERRIAHNTHEWCAPGTPPMIEELASQPFDDEPTAYSAIERCEIVRIADTDALGPEWDVDRRSLLRQDIRSMLLVPFTDESSVAGYIGFDATHRPREWAEADGPSLTTAAAMVAQALTRRRAEERFAELQRRSLEAFRGSPAPLAALARSGEVLDVSAAWSRELGIERADLLGRHLGDLVHVDDRHLFEEVLAELRVSPSALVRRELRLVVGMQRWSWFRFTGSTEDSAEARSIVTALIENLDAQRATEAALATSEGRFENLVDNLPDAVLRVNRSGELLYANRVANELLDVRDDVEAPTIRFDHAALAGAARAFSTGATTVVEHESSVGGGPPRWYQTLIVPEHTAAGTVETVLSVSRDLTELKHSERELARQALHDSMTGLPNRSLFLSHLEAALRRLHRREAHVAVLFFDLDRLKIVNDSLGHAAGDELLRIIGNRLRTAIRPPDVVARLGGDEFTVLVEGVADVAEAVRVAERLRRLLGQPVTLDSTRRMVTSASIGIALTNDPTFPAATLLENADAAMYRAKQSGRDRTEVFDEEFHRAAQQRLTLESDLRWAIEHDRIDVWYQPEVDLTTGTVVGAEALARWPRPGLAVLPAADFIEIAEDSGLIVPLGRRVIARAIGQMSAWRCQHPDRPFVLRVNLSARQLSDPHLIGIVGDALALGRLPATDLCFELTETALLADPNQGSSVLAELRELGVRLALDDFGTGYSSLARLKRFPLDVLKIDRSFVDGLPTDPDDLAIVTSIIGLASSLGLDVTAEGIETEAQAAALRSLGCVTGQGFLFGHAVPLTQFVQLVDETFHTPGG